VEWRGIPEVIPAFASEAVAAICLAAFGPIAPARIRRDTTSKCSAA
jgi:hypothetical protein